MAPFNPNNFYPGSPNELILFLDSVINSSLCPHTKDWVCYLYTWIHNELCQLLGFSIRPNMANKLLMVQYHGIEGSVPLRLHDLVSYVEAGHGLTYPVIKIAQAQSIKRISSADWDIVAHNIAWRIPLPIRVEMPNMRSHGVWERFNPAVWFALQGQYTLEHFIAGRPLWLFIDEHWRRLSSHFGNARTGKWEYHDALDRCRCPGYELPRLLAGAEHHTAADAVMKEILGHVDPLIVEHLKPALETYEDERRRASLNSLQSWYQPQGSTVTWNHVAQVPALEAVSNRVLIAFEALRNNPQFRVIAEERVAAIRASEMRRM